MERREPAEGAPPPGWAAVWRYLAAELRTTPARLHEPGCHLVAEAPLPRPYFVPPEGLLAAFSDDHGLHLAAAEGFIGFARAWLHHHHNHPATALAESGLRWLRQNLARAEARLLTVEQYAILSCDLPARLDPRVRRLAADDAPALVSELGWSPAQAAEWLPRGVYAAFVGDRLACRVCTYHLGERVAELGVRTLPEFRRQGLATAAVQVAAAALLEQHDAVLYTCATDNEASLAVARRLGARHCGHLLHVLAAHQAVETS